MTCAAISPAVRVGPVHLRVADLERATAFYRDMLGTVTIDGRPRGLPAVSLAAGDYHRSIALNSFSSAGGPPPASASGLHHLALLYPGRQELARAVRHLRDGGYPLDGAQDHGGTISVYLRDPDQNGIELYCDLPRDQWFDAAGELIVRADPIDLDTLC
jgi:catechol 2,3-dioxygenase